MSEYELLTSEEAAAFLHIPLATLRHWGQVGTAPPSAKIGKRRMYRKPDLIEWVEAKFAASPQS